MVDDLAGAAPRKARREWLFLPSRTCVRLLVARVPVHGHGVDNSQSDGSLASADAAGQSSAGWWFCSFWARGSHQ